MPLLTNHAIITLKKSGKNTIFLLLNIKCGEQGILYIRSVKLLANRYHLPLANHAYRNPHNIDTTIKLLINLLHTSLKFLNLIKNVRNLAVGKLENRE